MAKSRLEAGTGWWVLDPLALQNTKTISISQDAGRSFSNSDPRWLCDWSFVLTIEINHVIDSRLHRLNRSTDAPRKLDSARPKIRLCSVPGQPGKLAARPSSVDGCITGGLHDKLRYASQSPYSATNHPICRLPPANSTHQKDHTHCESRHERNSA
ncbi:MAG: hypothetical protein Q9202_001326 [Teloschistes flavicans]